MLEDEDEVPVERDADRTLIPESPEKGADEYEDDFTASEEDEASAKVQVTLKQTKEKNFNP